MNTLKETDLEQITAGVTATPDSLAEDLGQFLGGGVGWIRANPLAYFLLGPGIGGFAAIGAGFFEASR